MPRTSDARTRFIAAALRLFQTRGYNGVGLSELIAEAKAPKGSFYHHFPGGKEELGELTVQAARDVIRAVVARAFEGAPDVETATRALTAAIADRFERSGYSAGCPITSIMLDTVPASARLAAAIEDAMAVWIADVAGHVARLDPGHPDPRGAALGYLVAIEGAWIVARALRSRAPFETVAIVNRR